MGNIVIVKVLAVGIGDRNAVIMNGGITGTDTAQIVQLGLVGDADHPAFFRVRPNQTMQEQVMIGGYDIALLQVIADLADRDNAFACPFFPGDNEFGHGVRS